MEASLDDGQFRGSSLGLIKSFVYERQVWYWNGFWGILFTARQPEA